MRLALLPVSPISAQWSLAWPAPGLALDRHHRKDPRMEPLGEGAESFSEA